MASYNCCMTWGDIIFSINFAAGFVSSRPAWLIAGMLFNCSVLADFHAFTGKANVLMPRKIKIVSHGPKRKHNLPKDQRDWGRRPKSRDREPPGSPAGPADSGHAPAPTVHTQNPKGARGGLGGRWPFPGSERKARGQRPAPASVPRSTAAPSRGRSGEAVLPRSAAVLSHTASFCWGPSQTSNSEPFRAAGFVRPWSRRSEDASGHPVPSHRHKLHSACKPVHSEARTTPAPPPRPFPQCTRPTHLSEPTPARKPEGNWSQRPVGNVVRSREGLVNAPTGCAECASAGARALGLKMIWRGRASRDLNKGRSASASMWLSLRKPYQSLERSLGINRRPIYVLGTQQVFSIYIQVECGYSINICSKPYRTWSCTLGGWRSGSLPPSLRLFPLSVMQLWTYCFIKVY